MTHLALVPPLPECDNLRALTDARRDMNRAAVAYCDLALAGADDVAALDRYADARHAFERAEREFRGAS
jgi:hypothetical protein